MKTIDKSEEVLRRPTPIISVESPQGIAFFKPSNYFKTGPPEDSLVKISSVSQNFKLWFLGEGDLKEKYEEPKLPSGNSAIDFTYRDINYGQYSKEIFESIAGASHYGISELHQLYTLMSKHAQLQKIGLGSLILGNKNIFFVHDENGTVREVRIEMYEKSWEVHSFNFNDRSAFKPSYTRVFFKYSSNLHGI